MEEQSVSPDDSVTIDHHIHYVALSGRCRPAIVIDAGDGETIAWLFAFLRPDEGHSIWSNNCRHDEETKQPDTWHFAFCEDRRPDTHDH